MSIRNNPNKLSGIYRITNLTDGKIYIGQTRDFERRMKDYQYRVNAPSSNMEKIIAKYGKDNFKYELIEECAINKLDEREIYYIHKFNAIDPEIGYNKCKGGGSHTHTEDTKIRMMVTHTGMKESPATKKRKSKRVVAINDEDLIIADSGKLLGEYLGYTKDIVSHAVSQPHQLAGYFVYNWDYDIRHQKMEKFIRRKIKLNPKYMEYFNYLDRSVETSETITMYLTYDE